MFKILAVFIVAFHLGNSDLDLRELKCIVCRASLDELQKAVNKLDPNLKTETGSFRLDSEGNLRQKTISQVKSELVLSEKVDDVCKVMDDYVRVIWKSNGTLAVMKMITDTGGMNPELNNVQFVQDEDLNKSLKYYCETLMEEYEEDILKAYIDDVEDIKDKVCRDSAGYCLSPQDSVEKEEL